jgi:hypothetical protein
MKNKYVPLLLLQFRLLFSFTRISNLQAIDFTAPFSSAKVDARPFRSPAASIFILERKYAPLPLLNQHGRVGRDFRWFSPGMFKPLSSADYQRILPVRELLIDPVTSLFFVFVFLFVVF